MRKASMNIGTLSTEVQKRDRDQNIFEESMTKNFLNLMKAINYLTKVQKRYLERKLLLDIKL